MYRMTTVHSHWKVTVRLIEEVRILLYFKKIFKNEYFMISVSAEWEPVRKENDEQVNE